MENTPKALTTVFSVCFLLFVQSIHNLIDVCVSMGTKPDEIVVGGHSQGGALAIYSAITYSSHKENNGNAFTVDTLRYVKWKT